MDCKKYAEIVHETVDEYIATIWTGANYYIGVFSKVDLAQQIRFLEENGIHRTLEKVISTTHVDEMWFMCPNEEYSQSLLDEWISFLINMQNYTTEEE